MKKTFLVIALIILGTPVLALAPKPYFGYESGLCYSSFFDCLKYNTCRDCHSGSYCGNCSTIIESSCQEAKGCVRETTTCPENTTCFKGLCVDCNNAYDNKCECESCTGDPDCQGPEVNQSEPELENNQSEYSECVYDYHCASGNCVTNYTYKGVPGTPEKICCDEGQCALFQCGPPCMTQCIDRGQCATQTPNIPSAGYFPEDSCALELPDDTPRACGCSEYSDPGIIIDWDPENNRCCDNWLDDWLFNKTKGCDNGKVVNCNQTTIGEIIEGETNYTCNGTEWAAQINQTNSTTPNHTIIKPAPIRIITPPIRIIDPIVEPVRRMISGIRFFFWK